MLAHCRVTTSFKFVSTHLYTWVERGTARVKQGLEPGPLNPETGETMRLPCLSRTNKHNDENENEDDEGNQSLSTTYNTVTHVIQWWECSNISKHNESLFLTLNIMSIQLHPTHEVCIVKCTAMIKHLTCEDVVACKELLLAEFCEKFPSWNNNLIRFFLWLVYMLSTCNRWVGNTVHNNYGVMQCCQ